MPEKYHRVSEKKMSPWAARMKRRGSEKDVKVKTTKESQAERLTRRAAREARMTPAERRKAERKRVDDFMRRRAEQLRPQPATPEASKPPSKRGIISTAAKKRRDLLEALGQKKGKK